MQQSSKTPSAVIDSYQELNWNMVSHFDPIIAERRIQLMEEHSPELIEFVLELLLRSKEEKYKNGIIHSCHQLCILYRLKGDKKNALLRQEIAERTINTQLNYPLLPEMAHHFHDFGIHYFRKGSNSKSKKYLKKALTRYITVNSASCGKCVADCHYRLGKLDMLVKDTYNMRCHFLTALSIVENDQSMEWRVSEMCFQLGISFFCTRKLQQADDFLVKAVRLQQKFGQLDLMAQSFNALGKIRKKQRLFDESQKYFDKSLQCETSSSQPNAPSSE